MKKSVIFATAAFVFAAAADTLTWTGKGDGVFWSDSRNWSSDGTHTVPESGDSVIAKVNAYCTVSNDIEGLSLPYLELVYNRACTDTNTSSDPAYFRGKEITLTGGLTAFKSNYEGRGVSDARLYCYIPFRLDSGVPGGTNKFTIVQRLFNCGGLSGPDYLWISNNGAYDATGPDTRTAGLMIDEGAIFDISGAYGLGDGTYPAVYKGSSSGGYIRLYANPKCWLAVDQPSSFADNKQTVGAYGARTFDGPISGTRFVFTFYNSSKWTCTFNGDINIPSGNFHFLRANGSLSDHSVMAQNAIFNGRVNVQDFGRFYQEAGGTNTFNHADNAIANFYSLYSVSKAGAVNAFGTNAVVRFGYRSDLHGYMDMCGYDQKIDRFALNSSYLVNAENPDGHLITSTSGSPRLTLAATDDCETDAKFGGSLSLVWAPVGSHSFTTYAAFGRVMPMTGGIVVSNGTFTVNGTNSFPFATSLEVADGAEFNWTSTAPNGLKSVTNCVIGATASLSLPAGVEIPLQKLVVGGAEMPCGTYSGTGGAGAGVTVLTQLGDSAAMLYVPQGEAEAVEATWTGGADGTGTDINEADNWKNLQTAPDHSAGSLVPTFAEGGTNAVIGEFVIWKGLVFDAPGNFTLESGGASANIRIGSAGIAVAAMEEGTRSYAIDAPVTIFSDQTWTMAENATLTFNGPLVQQLGGYVHSIVKTGPGSVVFNAEGSTFNGSLDFREGPVSVTGSFTDGNGIFTIWTNSPLTMANADIAKRVDVNRQNGEAIICAEGTTNHLRGGWRQLVQPSTAQSQLVVNKNAELTIWDTFNDGGAGGIYPYLNGKGTFHLRTDTDKTACMYINAYYIHVWKPLFVANRPNYIQLSKNSRIYLHVENAVTKAPFSMYGTFDLCGIDQTMGRFSYVSKEKDGALTALDSITGVIRSDEPATLTVYHDDNAGGGGNKGRQIYAGKFEGMVSFVKTGASNAASMSTNDLILAGANTATGSVAVTWGLLSFTNRFTFSNKEYIGSWRTCTSATAEDKGTLELCHSKALGRMTDVYVGVGGKLRLASGVDQRIRHLYLANGEGGAYVRQRVGKYGSSSSSAPEANRSDVFFEGPGVLTSAGEFEGSMLIFK